MTNKINSFIEEKEQEKTTEEAPTPVVEQFQPSIIQDEVEVIAEIAERRVEAVKKIIQAALKLTNYNDWVLFSGKPYLTATGADKLMVQFGISMYDLKVDEIVREDKDGKWIEFVAQARFKLGSVEITAIGTSSTRSKFFGYVHGELKPIEAVDIPSVRKAAVQNCKRNGVLTLLGLRSPTLEQMREAGIDVNKIQKVEYKKGAK